MKTLATYKREYLKAKTQKGKQSAMNRAMLNLNYEDKKLFMSFQIKTLDS